MNSFRCKMCGGSLEIPEGVSSCTCEYCGTKQTIPTVKDLNIQGLFNRANVLRMKSEFDKASDIYEKIVQNSPEEAEAYWGLILCKYGIEYVEDPKTFKRIPTCHRVSYEPVSADEDYKNALLYADAIQRGIYESQAKEIDEVQRGILQLVQKEDPYDIFICYKETDENGKRTQDSVIANDIYYQLTHEGFKVFFSAITLEDKLGSEYEPYIFSALSTAKVMLALGTRPEYFNAVWVKNEWSRFLKIMKKDRSRLLIPCYRDMDPYELPEEFAHLQAQDMSKIGFINDLVRGIKKVIAPEVAQIPVIEKISPAMGYTSNVNALLKRAQMALEDKEWKKADDFYEEVLNQNAECAEAFIGKLLIQKHFSSEVELFDAYERQYQEAEYQKQEACPADEDHIKSMVNQYEIEGYLEAAEIVRQYDFDRVYESRRSCRERQKDKQLAEIASERLLARAMQYANGTEKSRLEERNERLRQTLDNRIEEAKQEDAINSNRIKEAYQKFLTDTDQKVRELNRKASEKREEDYQNLLNSFFDASKEQEFRQLEKDFLQMHGYKDSESFEEKCRQGIDRIKQEELEEQRRKELVIQKEKQRKAKRNKKIAGIVNDGSALLLSKYAIDWKQYNDNSSTTRVLWSNCTLRNYLNSTFFTEVFQDVEKQIILDTKISDVGTTDKVFLLSVSEASQYWNKVNEIRQCELTTSALLRAERTTLYYMHNRNSETKDKRCTWWLRTPGEYVQNNATVSGDGSINSSGISCPVDEYYGIRPAMWIDLGRNSTTSKLPQNEDIYRRLSSMSIFKCKMCGGTIEFEPGATVGVCDSCGTKQTLPRLDTDRKANLYDRANHFRRNNDFDKAMGIYEQILNEDNTDSEAYWSLVLAVMASNMSKILLRTNGFPRLIGTVSSIYMDEDYKSALQYADVYQRQVYEEEAKTIDDIQKGILEISNKEEPFDVFICYKETDNNGRRTQDSVLANDLYHQLTQEGFKVFFSRITLEDKLGTAYEPYIFAALNSAKIMVVLGTMPEYFNAVWVKNEWSRYLALVKQSNGKKILIPAYRDMDPYDLPEEFSHLQAQDMSKLGFMQDLIRGIKKIIGTEQPQVVRQDVATTAPAYGSNVEALLKRGRMALEDGEWQKADDFYEEVLNQNAECSAAFMGKLLAQKHRSSEAALFESYENLSSEAKYETLEAFPADEEHLQRIVNKYAIEGYLEKSVIIRQYEFDRTYRSKLSSRENQKELKLKLLSSERLLVRAQQYASGNEKAILEGRLSKLKQLLDDRIEEARQEDAINIQRVKEAYQKHLEEADQKIIELHQEASAKREKDYQDKVSLKENAKTIAEYKTAKDQLDFMHGYKDTKALAEECQKQIDRLKKEEERAEKEATKKKKIILSIISAVVAICVAFVIVLKTVIQPRQRFDSEILALNTATVGAIVNYGRYDGKELSWIVLAKEDGKVLLISEDAIVQKEYNTTRSSVTWETCSLRIWLNDSFINDAFNSYEKAKVTATTVTADKNPEYNTSPGNNTTDKVFLLSVDEVNQYFSSDAERICKYNGSACWWWLRSPGYNSDIAACVLTDGSVHNSGTNVNNMNIDVRPALWMDLGN